MDCLAFRRTPIHEALHPLATENLAIIATRRDPFVTDMTFTHVHKIAQ